MLRSLSARQWRELVAFYSIEPLEAARADIRAARITQMIHNVQMKREHQRPLKDFLLDFGGERSHARTQTAEEQAMMIRLMALSLAGEKR